MKQNKNLISWGRIVVALIFLFNPNIGLVDILPDVIGYLLLCTALAKISMIDERIGDVHALLVRLFYITLVRFACLFVTFSVIPFADRATALLLFSFSFDVLELITLVPALVKLFDGILYLSDRHDGEAAYARVGRSNKTITERTRNTAIVFVFAKAFFGTLPEFATLSSHEGWNESSWGRMYQYIGLFRMVGIIFSLAFGIVFLIRTLKYVSALKKDKQLEDRLVDIYNNDVASKTDLLARRAIKNSFGYFSIAAVLMLDFNLDGFNVLPDVLVALCILGGLWNIRKYITNHKIAFASATVFGIAALIQTVFEYIFASKYFVEAIDVDPETYSFYIGVCLTGLATAVMFVITVTVLMKCTIAEIIDKHTGFSMTSNDTYDPSSKIKQLHKDLKRRLIILISLAIASAILSVLSKVLVTSVGFLWILTLIVDVIYAVYTFKILSEIKEQIDYKYMLS